MLLRTTFALLVCGCAAPAHHSAPLGTVPSRVVKTDAEQRGWDQQSPWTEAGPNPDPVPPLSTSPAWTADGGPPYDRLGSALSGAGDVNGDGYDDVVVGATGYNDKVGCAYLFLGSSGGLAATAAAQLTGEGTTWDFGRAVSGAGDVNGDGYDDVLVSGIWSDVWGETWLGYAYVFMGSASGLSNTDVLRLGTQVLNDNFSHAIAGAGDVNGDGYDDVIVGAEEAWLAYLYYGSPGGLDTEPLVLEGQTAHSFGYSVAGAGDVDGDGYDDVLVGASGNSLNVGSAWLYLGSATGLSASPSMGWTGESDGTYLGHEVSGVGDVNADGYGDLAIGEDDLVHLHLGSASGPSAAPTLTLSGGDHFGSTLDGAGDVDQDGYADMIVGEHSTDTTIGYAHVYYGATDGLDPSPRTLEGETVDDLYGYTLSGAGDVNGDDYGDVLVGASAYSGDQGRVYLYLGHRDEDGDGFATSEDCDDSDPDVHPDAEEICDGIDNDCDGTIDVGAVDAGTWYADDDGDGYGDPSAAEQACEPGEGQVADASDCDDADPEAYPGATEIPDDGIDQDCDGADLEDDEPEPADTGEDKDPRGCSTLGDAGFSPLLLLLLPALLRRRRTP
jgi:uncharacterized protein (TIGR03382 family)